MFFVSIRANVEKSQNSTIKTQCKTRHSLLVMIHYYHEKRNRIKGNDKKFLEKAVRFMVFGSSCGIFEDNMKQV